MPAAMLPRSSTHPSTLGMSKGELGLLSIPYGDQKFEESSPMAPNPCLGLLKDVASLSAVHHSLLRSCHPPSVLVEPWREASPALLRAKPASTAEAREEGA